MNEEVARKKLNRFFNRADPTFYKKGEIILRGGDMPQGVYFLKKGYVKLDSVSKEGKELTLIIYKPEEFFPVVWTFFGDRTSIYSFEAITDCEILRVSRGEFLEFINSNQVVFLEVTKGIIARFQIALRRMEYLAFGNASAKLASILLICAKDFGVQKNKEVELQIPLTHKEIANLVGVTRETVSLELKKFDRQGLIGYRGKFMVIKDHDGLEEKAILS